jgi:2-keto-3-deoxy-L-rhamnonate aldolase RhmA
MKELLLSGKTVIGAQLRFGSPAVAELFGQAGFDYVVFDTEHAPQTPVGVQQQIQALASTPATPIVRMLKNDADLPRPFLDMGAGGTLVPFVNSAEDARIGAQALRYPPEGTRGYGPSRASRYGFDKDYFGTANAAMVFLPIIEDVRAVHNIEELLAVPGVDSFIIGPVDLSISLGVPMQFDHSRFKDAVRTIVKAGQAARKPLGTALYGGDMFEPDTWRSFTDQGFTLLLAGGDEWMLQATCRRLLDAAHAARKGAA